MYFEDDTFKTFLLLPSTTATDLCQQVRQKLSNDKNYFLYASAPGVPESYIQPNQSAWPFYKQHGDKAKFVFKLTGPPAAGFASPAPMPAAKPPPVPAAKPPPVPATKPAPRSPTVSSAKPQPTLPKPRPPAVTSPPPMVTPDFDLLSEFQTSLNLGPAPSGGQPSSTTPSERRSTVSESDFDALLNQLQFDAGGGSTFDPLGGLGSLATTSYPTCSACGELVKQNLLNAFGMAWHKEHLACAICRRNFLENPVPVVEGNDGKAYCQTDYLDRFAPKCAQCTKPIQGECTNALGKQWHATCFVCKTCQKPFTGTFFEHEGFAFCEKHYYEEKGLICPECDRPIIGKCVRARDKRYHPQHFVCSHCKHKLTGNAYYLHDNKLFCKSCSIIFYG